MEAEKIVSIIESVSKSSLTEVEIEAGEVKIKLSKASGTVNVSPVAINEIKHVEEKKEVEVGREESAQEVVSKNEENVKEIVSPIVGIFYGSPKPDAANFVSVGKKVKKGEVLCIIEAMKLMNEINAEYDCEIVEICCANEQMVEFGSVLFKVKAL